LNESWVLKNKIIEMAVNQAKKEELDKEERL